MTNSHTRTPTYRRLKQEGRHDRAFVEIDGQRHYLGRYGMPESKQRYDRLIAEYLANDRQIHIPPEQATVVELCSAFWNHAQKHYRKPDGTPTSRLSVFKSAIKPIKNLYGDTLANDFSPRELKTVRATMINKGYARKTVNDFIGMVKQIFAWGVENSLVNPEVLQGLRAVRGLQAGRTEAPETESVKPVPDAHIDKIFPHVSAEVAAMVELQRLTGMRPGEVCIMRSCDIDTSGVVWVYTPTEHKSSWRGKDRKIFIGKQAQAVLSDWLNNNLQAYLFDPRAAEQRRRAKGLPNMKGRKQANPRRDNQKANSKKTDRVIRNRYVTGSYNRAIRRACVKAGVPHWSPNQLRHNFATLVRRDYGLEAAQVLLGHSKADVTQIYAERDINKAIDVIEKIG